jgi:hypothetical protein
MRPSKYSPYEAVKSTARVRVLCCSLRGMAIFRGVPGTEQGLTAVHANLAAAGVRGAEVALVATEGDVRVTFRRPEDAELLCAYSAMRDIFVSPSGTCSAEALGPSCVSYDVAGTVAFFGNVPRTEEAWAAVRAILEVAKVRGARVAPMDGVAENGRGGVQVTLQSADDAKRLFAFSSARDIFIGDGGTYVTVPRAAEPRPAGPPLGTTDVVLGNVPAQREGNEAVRALLAHFVDGGGLREGRDYVVVRLSGASGANSKVAVRFVGWRAAERCAALHALLGEHDVFVNVSAGRRSLIASKRDEWAGLRKAAHKATNPDGCARAKGNDGLVFAEAVRSRHMLDAHSLAVDSIIQYTYGFSYGAA